MMRRSTLCLALLLATAASVSLAATQEQARKAQVTNPSDLPSHTYVIKGKPSEVVQSRDALLALATRMEKDLKADLDTYDVRDKTVLQRIYGDLYAIEVLKKDNAEARRYLDLVRGLQETPAARLMTGVMTGPYLEAMDHPGADFHASFRAELSKGLAALPYNDVQGMLKAMNDGLTMASTAQMVGGIEAGLDPAVKDGQLSQEMAEGLVGMGMNLHVVLPVKDDILASLAGLFEAHKNDQATVNVASKGAQPVLGYPRTPIKGAYFGQPLPGETPVLFAPEILNEINMWAEGIAFSPDGTECFLGVGSAEYSGAKTFYSTRVDDMWKPFVEPAFLSDFVYSNEPDFSSDGKTLIFTGKKAAGSKDFWTVRRTGQGWSAPVALPSPINSDQDEYRGSTTSDGTIYFGRSVKGLYLEVHKAYKDAGSLVVERLGAPINTQSTEGDPCVAPDGHYLVFYSGRVGGKGGADLYVSFKDDKGVWGTPINLGSAFNSADDEYGAHLSSDGRYLFFTRHTAQGNRTYWVAASAIDKIKG